LFGLDHQQLRHKTGSGDLRLVKSDSARIAKELLA